jgi:acetyl-CoA carboxylase carboxyltransferase component
MSGDAAADTLWMVGKKQVFHQLDDPTESEMRLAEEKFKRPILEQYGRESDPYFATARLWDDGILDPVKTRAALGLAFATTGHGPRAAGGYGTFRM